ncbi:MAG: metal-sulfur cluster assembly factor [Rhodocyclales bacterium]|nr:metal-sulfur cluster assembly factor [Rhodocyclales bacterium]
MTSDPPKPAPDDASIRKLLRRVVDPEVGMNIVDLGLVYRIEATPQRVLVEMTMTSPACPLGEMITDEVKDVLARGLPPGCAADIRLVWEPPWQQSMMSEAGKRHFGWEDPSDG